MAGIVKYLFQARSLDGDRGLIRQGSCARYDEAQQVAAHLAKSWGRAVEIWKDAPGAKYPMETIEPPMAGPETETKPKGWAQ